MKHLWYVLLLVALIQYGCSGPDGGSASTTQPAPSPAPVIDPNLSVPVRTAFSNVVQHGFNQSFTITGTVDNSTPSTPAPLTNVTGSGQFVLSPGTPTTLCTFSVSKATQTATGTTVANGISTPFSTTGTIYYRSDNTTVAMDSTDGFFLFAPVAYPETVKAGDTGTVGKGDEFNRDCTQTFFPKTITGSYAVKADSANSLLVTFISTNNNEPLAGSEAQTATTYRITTSGAITLVLIVTVEKFNSKAFRTLTFTF